MVWNAKSYRLRNAPCISFLLLIIKSFSFSSSSIESYVVFLSLAHMCFSDLLDEARGHLVCYNLSFNFEVFSFDVEASYTQWVQLLVESVDLC
jgi:hypothetical protein